MTVSQCSGGEELRGPPAPGLFEPGLTVMKVQTLVPGGSGPMYIPVGGLSNVPGGVVAHIGSGLNDPDTVVPGMSGSLEEFLVICNW